MPQTIRYMSKAVGVTPAADHAAGTILTGQPLQGSVPALNQQVTGVPIFQISDITLTAALDPLATNDIYVAGCLPADHILIDFMIDAGDIDTATALVLSAGLLYPDFTDLVAAATNVITSSTVGQLGGRVRAGGGTSDLALGLIQAVNTVDTWYGIKVVTGATGLNAGAKMRAIMVYIPSGN